MFFPWSKIRLAASLARRVAIVDLHIEPERARRRQHAGRQRQARNGSKKRDACIAPSAGFAQLHFEQLGRLGEALGIHVRLQHRPAALHLLDLGYAEIVAPHERIPERVPIIELPGPGQVMEPEQTVFTDAIAIGELAGITPLDRAIQIILMIQ